MRGSVWLGLTLTALPALAAQPAGVKDLDLRTTVTTSQEPLTTEKISKLDPAQPNPHLRRWIVSRRMEIEGWRTKKLAERRVGIQGGVLQASTEVFLRPDGPWYSVLTAFPCDAKKPDPIFATLQGTRDTADAAAQLWDTMLSNGKIQLSLRLHRISGPNDKSAWAKADRDFQEWLVLLDHEWRARVESEIVAKQWQSYLKEARDAGFCDKSRILKAEAPKAPVPPEQWMDQASGDTGSPLPEKPLTHAPARRWQGLFSVRMDVGLGDSAALGQMLIDPATPRSVLSPEWMLSQGLRPEWIEIPEAEPMHVKIEAGDGEKGLGNVARVGTARISGYHISLTRYLIFKTELFDEPESAASCCSGVLGLDFLRRYAVEFDAPKPTAIQLWTMQGYRPPQGYEWVEVRESENGELLPICSARVRALPGAKKLCENPREVLKRATAPIVFDLPHGKIWYSPEELNAPEYRNDTGVKLNFGYIKGDRVLQVVSLGDAPAARELAQAGLKKGMVIEEVDGIPAIEMDLWEVNRHLAGVYGKTVTLKWKSAKGYQTTPLSIHFPK